MNIAVTVEYSKIKDMDFSDLCGTVYEMVLEIGRNIVEEVIEERGKEVHAARDDKKYEDKGYRTTTVKTKLDPLDLRDEPEEDLDEYIFDGNPPLTPSRVPYSVGKGYNGFKTAEVPAEEYWLKDMARIRRF